MVQLEGELRALAAGELPAVEPLTAELEALPLVIGADGVRVPFRPHPRTAKGKTRWREIKVAILARLGARLSRKANAREPPLPAPVSGGVGHDRRLGPAVVAGSRAPRGAHGDAGGVALGWWAGFVERVPAPLPGGRGGSDFRLLHAAQNLYKGASAWLEGRTRACQQWFADLRHRLRHGHEQHVLAELAALVEATPLPQSARQTLSTFIPI